MLFLIELINGSLKFIFLLQWAWNSTGNLNWGRAGDILATITVDPPP